MQKHIKLIVEFPSGPDDDILINYIIAAIENYSVEAGILGKEFNYESPFVRFVSCEDISDDDSKYQL